MAKATKTDAVTRIVREASPAVVTLTLSPQEAETLVIILANVGGPDAGRRGHADGVYRALSRVIGDDGTDCQDFVPSEGHSLYFTDKIAPRG